jgi:hypothetical protein
MGVVKTAFKKVQDTVDPSKKKKESKAGHFMEGLKDFVTSPGGILTLVLIGITIWYVHHKTAEE